MTLLMGDHCGLLLVTIRYKYGKMSMNTKWTLAICVYLLVKVVKTKVVLEQEIHPYHNGKVIYTNIIPFNFIWIKYFVTHHQIKLLLQSTLVTLLKDLKWSALSFNLYFEFIIIIYLWTFYFEFQNMFLKVMLITILIILIYNKHHKIMFYTKSSTVLPLNTLILQPRNTTTLWKKHYEKYLNLSVHMWASEQK